MKASSARAAVGAGALLVPLTAAFVPVKAAQAGPDQFSCRASVVRVQGQGPLTPLGTIEPFVANPPDDPCRTSQSGVINNAALPGGLGSLSLLYARTQNSCPQTTGQVCQEGQGATAQSGVLDLTLNLPAPIGPVRAQVLTSQATATCTSGQPKLDSRSTVLAVDVAGQHIEPVPQNFSLTIPGVGTLYLNQQTKTTSSITQRALFLDTAILDVVIAESIADYQGNPCTQSPPPPPPPTQRFPGWMTGGGYVAEPGTQQDHNGEGSVEPGTRVQHSFSIDCFYPTAADAGDKQHLEAQWFDDANNEHGSFKLVSLSDAACTDDGTASPGHPRSGFNRMHGQGTGICKSGNAQFPAMVDFTFTDYGEPGGDSDVADIKVTSPVQQAPVFCNFTEHGRLDGGNHQAHQQNGQRAG